MRREARERVTTQTEYSVNGYHSNRVATRRNYANAGFIGGNKYFTSDRYIALREDAGGALVRPDGKALSGYGLEIESECRGISNEAALATILMSHVFDVLPDGLFKLQSDCSLRGDSTAECITQVMTEAFIRNHYAEWKYIYDSAFPRFGVSCGSANCGMHVNISNAVFGRNVDQQSEAIKKLFYFIHRNYQFCCVLFNRNRTRTGFASPVIGPDRAREYVRIHSVDGLGVHGDALNTSNFIKGRVELRLVGGCGSFGAFRNTMESGFWVIKRVRALSWRDMDNLVKVFTGCNQYVFDRLTKCRTDGVLSEETVNAIRPTIVHEDLI